MKSRGKAGFGLLAVVLVCLSWLPAAGAPLGEQVSLIQLIATPAAYHGKLVRVQGFLHNKFEDCVLFLSKDDADHMINGNAIWVNFAGKKVKFAWRITEAAKLDGKYVMLQGIFNKDKHGHMGLFSGTLDGVESGMEMTRHYDGARELPELKRK